MRPEKAAQREARLVRGFCKTASHDTTSEPPGRNARMGAPITASMSDGFVRNQGGTVEYFVSHPCFVRGWDYFYAFPTIGKCKIQNAKCKMKVCLRHNFNSSAKRIPSFCIPHSAFCIPSIS